MVTAECQKRNYNRSDAIASRFGEGKYEFTKQPASQTTITQEHYEKIAIPLNAINKSKVTDIDAFNQIISKIDLDSLKAVVQAYDAYSDKTENVYNKYRSDCSGGCAGLCYSCSGTCTGSCTTTCTGVCRDYCKAGCDTTCTAECANSGCTQGCGFSGCSGECTTGCGNSNSCACGTCTSCTEISK